MTRDHGRLCQHPSQGQLFPLPTHPKPFLSHLQGLEVYLPSVRSNLGRLPKVRHLHRHLCRQYPNHFQKNQHLSLPIPMTTPRFRFLILYRGSQYPQRSQHHQHRLRLHLRRSKIHPLMTIQLSPLTLHTLDKISQLRLLYQLKKGHRQPPSLRLCLHHLRLIHRHSRQHPLHLLSLHCIRHQCCQRLLRS